MLDIHCVTGTPGAATVLGANFATIAPGGDGATVAGVPPAPRATLVSWGGLSPTADTIAALKMSSLDMVDPVNGENFTPGAASLLNILIAYDNLPYVSGGRQIQMGTNTGVVASLGYTMDMYEGGPLVMGSRFMPNQVDAGITTFGGALTARTWGTAVFAPTNPLPNGKYALLGARVSAIANAAVIRFQHVDFGQYQPGFPVANFETISTSTWDAIDKSELLMTNHGNQFAYLGEIMGKPQVPVFTVTNAGTGLTIWMISNQADTPVVHLDLAKVG
jgi:hypothetical protein